MPSTRCTESSDQFPKVYTFGYLTYCYIRAQKCTQFSSHQWAWRVWIQVIGFASVAMKGWLNIYETPDTLHKADKTFQTNGP